MTVESVNGVPVRLTEERWQHIVAGHPEMVSEQARVLLSLEHPDLIQEGDFGELLAICHWPVTVLGNKHIVVAYREVHPADGFVLTTDLTRRPPRARRGVWKR